MCSSLQRFSARQLVDLAMNNLTDTVTVQQFYQLCPALLQQMLMTSEAGLGAQDVEVEDTEMGEMDDSMPASAMQSECIGAGRARETRLLCSRLGHKLCCTRCLLLLQSVLVLERLVVLSLIHI